MEGGCCGGPDRKPTVSLSLGRGSSVTEGTFERRGGFPSDSDESRVPCRGLLSARLPRIHQVKRTRCMCKASREEALGFATVVIRAARFGTPPPGRVQQRRRGLRNSASNLARGRFSSIQPTRRVHGWIGDIHASLRVCRSGVSALTYGARSRIPGILAYDTRQREARTPRLGCNLSALVLTSTNPISILFLR